MYRDYATRLDCNVRRYTSAQKYRLLVAEDKNPMPFAADVSRLVPDAAADMMFEPVDAESKF